MTALRFRVPFEDPMPTPDALIRRAWPEGTDAQVEELFEQGAVNFDERSTRNPHKGLEPGWICDVEVPEGAQSFEYSDAPSLARGEGWVIVDKTVGVPGHLDRDDPMHPVLFMADSLGFDRSTFTPVWSVPARMGGPWVFGLTPDDAQRIREAILDGSVKTMWSALCPAPAIPAGRFKHEGLTIEYGVTRLFEGLAELQLTPSFGEVDSPVEALLDALADEGIEVIGDRRRGGFMAPGALRLRLAAIYDDSASEGFAHSWPTPDDFWPDALTVPPVEEIAIPEPTVHGVESLVVSGKTLEVMKDGHPWALVDRATGPTDHLDEGALVRLISRDQERGPFALYEGGDELLARFWSAEEDAGEHFREDVEIRFDEAVARRRELQRNLSTTDTYRLVHSEADGLPGFSLDRVGPLLRATISGYTANAFRHIVYESIADLDPEMTILEVAHLEDIRRKDGELPSARIVRKGGGYVREHERVVVREHGLKYWCEPWEGIDTGFFADQRESRARLLGEDHSGETWLNLFCHTGAFTVALVSRGAEVVSNDLSQRYLDWLDENLKLNGLDLSKNTNVADDARTVVKSSDITYDGIIVDPPTAARSDSGFWSVRKDYTQLLERCFGLLAENGRMLVCRNDRSRKPELEGVITEAAKSAGRTIAEITPATVPSDYPHLEGFTEGDPFEGFWVEVST